jgi:glycosyltransferase involved in cell wall biosynthesis
MKLMTTLLTSNDVPKLARLVKSVNNVIKISPIEWEVVIVVNSIHEGYYEDVCALNLPFRVVNTESNGKPGRGKNACLDVFLESDCDFVSQIDGDDFLYPSYLQSLWNHYKHYPCIDVLGVVPCDCLCNFPLEQGHYWWVNDNYHASVWGTSMCAVTQNVGPQESHLFIDERPVSVDFIMLQSRKSAQIKMNEDIGNGEDHAYTYKLLAEHQKGNICYFLTMSSDLYCIDRTTEGSAQKVHSYEDYLQPMRDEALKHVPQWRSSPYELPVIYKDLLMNQHQKQTWINKFINES